jgi:hypothetical protein
MHGTLEIRVVARDQEGNQVEVSFRIKLDAGAFTSAVQAERQDVRHLSVSKMGITRQLQRASQRGRLDTHGRPLKSYGRRG